MERACETRSAIFRNFLVAIFRNFLAAQLGCRPTVSDEMHPLVCGYDEFTTHPLMNY